VARRDPFGSIVRWVARRPTAILCAVALIALAGAVLALRLEPSASTDTLVDKGSPAFKATEDFRQEFGEEPVVVLVKGDLQRSILTPDLGVLLRLEGCMSGNVPKKGLARLPAVCTWFAQEKPAKVVYGPGTFINTAAGQIAEGFSAKQAATARQAQAAADAARKLSKRRGDSPAEQERLANQAASLVNSQFTEETLRLALRYGLTSIPSLDNVDFVSQLVFDPSRGVGEPKARFAYLFPSNDAALIQIRMRPDLSDSERDETVDKIQEAVADPQFALDHGGQYYVTGVPVVVDGLASAVKDSIFILLGAALLVMAATLALVFRTRLRLLPLVLALGAVALTFGAFSVAGASLTMASIAALPVLIGLAVDYCIQFQARFEEVKATAAVPPGAAAAATSAASAGGPTIATAGLSTAVAFLVLLLSPVPMVRGFGALLVVGIFVALGCALTAGFAALIRFSEPRPDVPPVLPRARATAVGWWDAVATSVVGQWFARVAARLGAWGRRAVDFALLQPRRVLMVGLAVAAIGWVADTQTEVISDVRELVPRDLHALQDVNVLQDATGVSGEIDVTLSGDDLTDPKVIQWMTEFQSGVLEAHGYKVGATCAQDNDPPELCPALSLPDLFRSGTPTSEQSVRALLDAVPPYFSQAVISGDRSTATLAFGIRLMPLDRQKDVIDDIKSRLDPPEGVDAAVVGLPVLAAEANDSLADPLRRFLTLLAGLFLVFVVLRVVRRSTREAAIPLIPIALATGWSALVLFLLRIPLNPMSAVMGALVIAISTEFSVLLSQRYREERAGGAGPEEAIEATYASTGAAVLASGTTAIMGFAALIASDIRMLRDFGIVTVVDLTVSLLGVMVVLPAALVWAERRRFGISDLDPRGWWRALREELAGVRVPHPSLPRPRLPRPRLPRPRRSRA
jgi:hydrophobe/amphiphile efflux-3 (HAE3) family protein